MDKKLTRGIIDVFSANLISLLLGVVTGFVVPKLLSVESYANIKTYQLYISYMGFLHFGFVDGIYLKYGGAEYSIIKKDELKTPYITLALFQIVIAIFALVIGIFLKDEAFVFFAISVIPLNMLNFYKNIYLATGEFKRYKNIQNWNTILTFVMILLILFVFRTNDYRWFFWGYTLVNLVVWIITEIRSKAATLSLKYFKLRELSSQIKSGFFLMLGNFSSILLTSIDRWFIKALMDTVAFAEYSFAVSMENLLTVAVTPITTTLYNYFCNNNAKEKVQLGKRYVTFAAVLIAASAFPVKFVIQYFLPKYNAAILVLMILFSSQIFYIPIKGVYVNLYKVRKQQNKYFRGIVSVVVIGVVLNALFYYLLRTKEAFAIGTLVSALLWYLLCCYDFKSVGFSLKEVIYSIAEIALLSLTGYYSHPVLGLAIYALASIAITIIIFPADCKRLVGLFINRIKRKQ